MNDKATRRVLVACAIAGTISLAVIGGTLIYIANELYIFNRNPVNVYISGEPGVKLLNSPWGREPTIKIQEIK